MNECFTDNALTKNGLLAMPEKSLQFRGAIQY